MLQFGTSEDFQGAVLIPMLTPSCTTVGVEADALPAGLDGTLLYFQQANISFQGARVIDIYAGSLDSIVSFNSCTHLNLTRFMSSGCQAKNQILSISNSSSLYVLDSSFCNASARGLSISDSNSELDGNVYENLGCLESINGGGARFVDNSYGYKWVSIKKSNFSGNFARNQHGGAVYMTGYRGYFEDNRFINNTNGVNGGAVLIAPCQADDEQAACTFTNSFFANNTAGFNGVVYGYSTVGSMSFYNCIFVGNLGYQGGAISLWAVAYAVFESCSFEGNSVR